MYLQELLDPSAPIRNVGRTQITLQEIPKASDKGNLRVVLILACLLIQDDALAGVGGKHLDDGFAPEFIFLVDPHC